MCSGHGRARAAPCITIDGPVCHVTFVHFGRATSLGGDKSPGYRWKDPMRTLLLRGAVRTGPSRVRPPPHFQLPTRQDNLARTAAVLLGDLVDLLPEVGRAWHPPAPPVSTACRGWGTSRSISRILFPACAGRRPSIWMHRCRAPRAVHPRARASSPRTPAQPHSRGVRPSTLLRAGFT